MYFPLFLDISGAKFLIVGGGNIALAKLEAILEFSDKITLLADEISSNINNITKAKNIKIINAKYDQSYLKGFDVVIVATNNNELNRHIAKHVKLLGKLVNIVDDPKNSDFIFGANIKRGNLTISISSSGVAPVLARFIKEKIQNILPKNLDILGAFLDKNKAFIRKLIPNLQSRRLFYQDVFDGNIIKEVEQGNIKKAQNILENKAKSQSNQNQGAVYFIGAGPGDPELITLKAINLLSRADVVLYDRLVASEILTYARREAIKINVGKVKDFHLKTQDQINELLHDYAAQGKIVARLKGGDTAIFARLSEEIAAIKDLNVPYQIVPGITAASGAASNIGIPLTSREAQKSVKFLTIYQKDLADETLFKSLAQAEDTLVFYMSAHNLHTISQKLVAYGKNPKTKLAVVEQATTKYQKTYISTLEKFPRDFANKTFTSPSLTIVGDVVNWHEEHKWREENLSGEFFAKLGRQDD